jgi:hypothetical protein
MLAKFVNYISRSEFKSWPMCEGTIEMTQIEVGCEDVNRTSSGYGPLVGFCNNCSEPSSGINVSFLIT